VEIIITTEQVTKVFKQLIPRKASGPDNVSPFLLKTTEELGPVWQSIFQLSLDSHTQTWKTSHIILIPNKPCTMEHNDY
jgi:hypothetical protein